MLRLFFKGAHSRVAVETLAVVEGCVELDVSRLWHLPDVLHINVAQSAKFGVGSTEHGVVRMAGIAGMIARNEIVLKMLGRDVTRVVDVEAAAEIVHNVAGEAELRAGGALHVFRVTQSNRHCGQNEKRRKGQNLAASLSREFGAGGH